MNKTLSIFVAGILLSLATIAQKPKTTATQKNKQPNNTTKAQPSKAPCDPNAYFPLYANMSYNYWQTLLGFNSVVNSTYTYFTTIKEKGKSYYGYTATNSGYYLNGNIYYNIDNGVVTEYFEEPDVTDEYQGSTTESINMFKFPTWDNTRTTDYYTTSVNYNSGNFRAVTILKINEPEGTKWSDTVTADNMTSIVTHEIIKKDDEFKVGNTVYKDPITVLRTTTTASLLGGNIVSSQYLLYARGVGLVAVNDINRNLLSTGVLKPERSIISYSISNTPVTENEENKFKNNVQLNNQQQYQKIYIMQN